MSGRKTFSGFLRRTWARCAVRRGGIQDRPDSAVEGQDVLACYADLGIPPDLMIDDRVQALVTAAAISVLSGGFIDLEHDPLTNADLRRLFGARRYSTGDFARRLRQQHETRQPHAALDRLERSWGEALAHMVVMTQARQWTANARPRTRVRHDSVTFGEDWSHQLEGPVHHVIEIEPGVPAMFAIQDLISSNNRRSGDRHIEGDGQRTADIERTYWTVSRTAFIGTFLATYPIAYTSALELPGLGRDLTERRAVASLQGDLALRLAQLAEQLSQDSLPYGPRDLVIWTDPNLLDTKPTATLSIVDSIYTLLRPGGGFLFASPLAASRGGLRVQDVLRKILDVFEIRPNDTRTPPVHLDQATGWTWMIAVKR